MSLTLPTHGEQGWDVKLNAALTALDAMDSTLAGQITAAITAAASDATAKVAAEVTARNAAITSAVNALVAGAPGALDTLVELATQLATDESAATTLTSLVGTKAPLASPALTGTPTAPTATGGTNTTQVATTAFTTAAVAAEATARASADAAEVTARNAAIATASATSASGSEIPRLIVGYLPTVVPQHSNGTFVPFGTVATSDSTAVADTDYTLVDGVLSLAPGIWYVQTDAHGFMGSAPAAAETLEFNLYDYNSPSFQVPLTIDFLTTSANSRTRRFFGQWYLPAGGDGSFDGLEVDAVGSTQADYTFAGEVRLLRMVPDPS